jgi:Tfp pilus assembly PilM family ATPase
MLRVERIGLGQFSQVPARCGRAPEQLPIKLLSVPNLHGPGFEERLLSGLSLEDAKGRRIGYKVIVEGHGKQESVLLAVSLPESEAASVFQLFPSGRPAPYSLEISGLAAISAFTAGPGVEHKAKAVAVLDIGTGSSCFAAFNRNVPVVCQRLDIGTRNVLLRVQESLGVDAETARGIVTDGAFDVSDIAGEVAGRLLNRIAVSRDFIERRDGCRLRTLYISGALGNAKEMIRQMESAFEVVKWNPLDSLNKADGAIPSDTAEPSCFAAAVGACLSTLEPA